MPLDINLSETSGPYVDDFLSPSPQQKYFVPICLGTFMINRSFLYEYIHELMQKNLNMNIIVGDYLERHNLMFFYGMSEEEALQKIEQKSNRIYSIIQEVIENHGANSQVQVHSCRDYVDTGEGRYIADFIRHYEKTNEVFSEDMKKQTSYIINSTLKKSGIPAPTSSAEMACKLHEYMIEEMVLYINLYKNGFVTEIYPGRDLEILKRIAKGMYEKFFFDYADRTHISVNLSLDSGKSYAKLGQ